MPAVSFDFNWLLDNPHDVAVMYAARMALRVAPLLGGLRGLRAYDVGEDVALPVFRAIAASWVSGRYPAHDAIADAASAACDAALSVARYAPIASARSAAAAAADAAFAAAVASGDPNAADAAVRACLAAVEATSLADFGATARADREIIDTGGGAPALAALPLWPAGGRPDWVPETWQRLAEALLKEDGDWRVWTNWYRARLEGGPVNESIEVARVLIAEEIWQQGARAVNAEIARLIAQPGTAVG
jgi:hypothetical protein